MLPVPTHFEYDSYLRSILGAEANESFILVSGDEFANPSGLQFPYRSFFYVVGLLHSHECELRVGYKDFILRERTVTFVGPGIVRQWLSNDWRAASSTIMFTPGLFTHPFQQNFLLQYPIFKPGINHTVVLTEAEYEYARNLLGLMSSRRNEGKILQGLVFAYLELVNSVYVRSWAGSISGRPGEAIAARFQALLYEHYRERKDVAFYSEKLTVPAKTLSGMLKDATGKTAKQAIDEFLLMEAKSLLRQTALEVKEIVYWLGFQDPSYFTKYFKERTGLTPLAFRRQGK